MTTLTNVSEDLKRLAPGQSAGSRAIRDLADKLVDTSKREELLGLSLSEAYAPEVMLPEGAGWLRWPLSILETVRDVLIFGPVIYTWFQLSEALRAYDHYTGTSPFLLAWQQGFGGQTQPLSTSALVVSALVATIIVLTLITHLYRIWYDTKVRYQQQKLAVLLAEAGMLLRTLGYNPAAVSREELSAMADSIIKSSLSLRQALAKAGADIVEAVNTSPGSQLHDMFKRWTAAASALTDLGKQLQGTQQVVAQLRDTQAALATLSQRIVRETEQLTDKISAQATQLTDKISAQTTQLTDKISAQTTELTSKVGTETRQLLTALKDEREATLQAAHAHSELAGKVSASTDKLGESLKGLSEQAEQFNTMVNQLAELIEELRTGEPEAAGPLGGVY